VPRGKATRRRHGRRAARLTLRRCGIQIDLHAHSTASDGTDTPEQLVAAATAAGLDVLAITDHDTTSGWDAALDVRPEGLTIVPGTEFSCVYNGADGGRISLHLLGYLFDPADEPLRAARARLRESRTDRGRRMVELLEADGYPVSWEQVQAIAGTGAVGRPHVGRVLVEAGVVGSVAEAFTGLIASSSPYFVRKANMDVFDALRLVRAAGGVTVFAHPLASRRGPVVGDDVIAAMAAAGLDGIEVDHADHDEEARRHAARLAGELGLVKTGSSDYHGTNKTLALGSCTTDPAEYERLLDRPTARRPVG
jgi:3',5'-nucleoside bisphosphate phosphatase